MFSYPTFRYFCFLALTLLLFYPLPAYATEEYAEKTDKECQFCHVDPSGGAELTAEGTEFQKTFVSNNAGTKRFSRGFSLLRFIVGYVHLLTAVFWFGTILYVHLILKPAYAARGLPKGEVRVGLLSMVIMLVTGIYLTALRLSSFSMLFETRFGILLLIKIALFLCMIVAALIAVFFVGPKLRRDIKGDIHNSGEDMTVDDLAGFDGKEGRPAYIAYAGNVYDVSNSGIWLQGMHFSRHAAGNDLTTYLSQAPHDQENILKMPKIGKLVTHQTKQAKSKVKKIFYFLAYLNLTLVFLIILIVALWRWWI